MKEPRIINISLSDKSFQLEFEIDDTELIETILNSLSEFVERGSPIKIMQTYASSLTESTRIHTRLISRLNQMNEWQNEVKQLVSVMRRKP